MILIANITKTKLKIYRTKIRAKNILFMTIYNVISITFWRLAISRKFFYVKSFLLHAFWHQRSDIYTVLVVVVNVKRNLTVTIF